MNGGERTVRLLADLREQILRVAQAARIGVADLDPGRIDGERKALGGELRVAGDPRRGLGARTGAAELDLARRREQTERGQTRSGKIASSSNPSANSAPAWRVSKNAAPTYQSGQPR